MNHLLHGAFDLLARCVTLGVFVWLATLPAAAQPGDDWPMERIWMRGEKAYRGLLLSQTERQIEFAEIVRPQGKPMYAVIRTLPARELLRRQELSTGERARLMERFSAFRSRAQIEAGRMDAVRLEPVERGGVEYLAYRGPWFTLLSTADEETTRRSIVRVEQTFCAYRQMFPPSADGEGLCQIVLYGSSAEYQTALAEWDVAQAHPAFYAPQRNVIVAGTDLDRFATELERARQENERTRQQLRSLRTSHEQTLLQVSADMKRAGFAADQIESEIRGRRQIWKEQHVKLESAIEEAQRQNVARYDEVARSMFRRLNHEAFHAYLDTYVYPSAEYTVPAWLHEGLAQVFENAQLDADTLRVDAPARELLAQLQVDLRGGQPLSLTELLSSEDSLAAAHRSSDATRRRYVYAWGLAYYLAFQRSELGWKGVDEYVANTAKSTPTVARFERWTGLPLAEFEQQWRKEMLQLK